MFAIIFHKMQRILNINALKADKKAIFRASSQAREATNFLLNALELTSNEEAKLAA